MPKKEKKIDEALRKKGLDPTLSFIVRKRVTYVPCDDLRALEVFQFISSIAMLIGGVFLGVVTMPNPTHPNFEIYITIAVIFIVVGIVIFYLGVHRQIGGWEKEKEAISVVG